MLAGLAGVASLAALPACGDGPICASEIAVFITTPDDGSTYLDRDDALPGVQSDVVVRTTLRQGELVQLRMIDQFGSEQFLVTSADGVGTAVFPLVTMPAGVVQLEATGFTEQCGAGQDRITIEVGFGTGCDLVLWETPVPNEYYAPLPVLDSDADSNAAIDGFQGNVVIQALPNATVELFVIDLATGLPMSAGARFTDFLGTAEYTLTIPEGAQALEANCIPADGSQPIVSNRVVAHVDSRPPTCRLTAPLGLEILPSDDADGDLSNGLQLEMTGEVEDDDPSGAPPLPPLFVVNQVSFEGSEPDDAGRTSVTVTLEDQGFYLLGIDIYDRAGNRCADLWPFEYRSTELEMFTQNRHSVQLVWTAVEFDELGTPAETYELRLAEVPIDEFNFDQTGFVVDGLPAPASPGSTEVFVVEELEPGKEYYAALYARGFFGERVFVGAAGPVKVDFDSTGPIRAVAPDDGNNGLGYQVAPGDYNDDGFGDLAVSAPFKAVNGQTGAGTVYVYFGGPLGLELAPAVTIEGSAVNEQLGNGLTAIQWDDDGVDDLAVGAPGANGFHGRVDVFRGGPDFGAQAADVRIEASAAPGDWFAPSMLGFALTRARFDADEREDLVITAPAGGGGNGGVVVVYGGATTDTIVLSSQDASGAGDAVALVLEDPDPSSILDDPPGPFFGHYVFPLGRTQGASDLDDDIGVAYTEKNAAVVFRGRARPGSAGVTVAGFDPALDLEIQRSNSGDNSSRFGTSMGSIADINGDGQRELAVGMWRDGNNIGRVEIYRGHLTGVHNASNIRLRSIAPALGTCTQDCGVGSAVVNNAAGLVAPDIDGDGLEDLIIVTGMGTGQVRLLTWFGGSIPTDGDIPIDSAQYSFVPPVDFEASALGPNEATPITAMWAGDINGDGLEDLCLSDWSANGDDGVLTVLYDDAP